MIWGGRETTKNRLNYDKLCFFFVDGNLLVPVQYKHEKITRTRQPVEKDGLKEEVRE